MVCDDSRAVGDVGCNMASLRSMNNNHSLWRKCHRPPVVGAKAADEKTESFAALAVQPHKDMQGSDFLTALHLLAEQEAMVKNLSDFKEKHKAKKCESIAALLTRAAEEGDEEAISLLAAAPLGCQTGKIITQTYPAQAIPPRPAAS